jgi:putative FmdB family regulatory protein
MPIYEYHCATCEDDFEMLVKSAESDALVACPSCTGENVDKKFSSFATGAGAVDFSAAATPAASRSCGPGCGCH